MRKNLLKPLYVAAFGMMACLGANAQTVSNATPDKAPGDEFWGSYYDFEVVKKVSETVDAVTYDVDIIGLSGTEAGEFQGDNQVAISIPKTVQVVNGGVKYTLNVKSVKKLQGYSALETLSFDADFDGKIQAGAIDNLTGLKEVIAEAPTAVEEVDAEAFGADIAYNTSVTLKVPEALASVRSYASKKGWRRFLNITNGTYTLGDVNNDGGIKTADLTLLQATINKKRDQNDPVDRYDVNGNGKFQANDLSILRAKINKTYK